MMSYDPNKPIYYVGNVKNPCKCQACKNSMELAKSTNDPRWEYQCSGDCTDFHTIEKRDAKDEYYQKHGKPL